MVISKFLAGKKEKNLKRICFVGILFYSVLITGCGKNLSAEFIEAEKNFNNAHAEVQALLDTGISYNADCILFHPFFYRAKEAKKKLNNALTQLKYVAYGTSTNEYDKEYYNNMKIDGAREDIKTLDSRIGWLNHKIWHRYCNFVGM